MAREKKEPGSIKAFLVDQLDVIGIILAGIAVGCWGYFSEPTKVSQLAKIDAGVLGVLAIVAFAAGRDRFSKDAADAELKEVHQDLAETRKALNALKLGRAYHVLLHDTEYDLQAKDGSVAVISRKKRLVTDQADMVALYDFFGGSGNSVDFEYSKGLEIVSDKLRVEGKRALLISLGRNYAKGSEIDIDVTRTAENSFKKNHEHVSVLTRDLTSILRMKIIWPVGRAPKTLTVLTISPERESTPLDVLDEVTMEEGRNVYKYEVEEPAKGSTTMIEWDW